MEGKIGRTRHRIPDLFHCSTLAVVKPNAVGALRRFGFNFCGGYALAESGRSFQRREYAIRAGATRERASCHRGMVYGRTRRHNGIVAAQALRAGDDNELANTTVDYPRRLLVAGQCPNIPSWSGPSGLFPQGAPWGHRQERAAHRQSNVCGP
jgi:hypothetical protein